jgi:hypothetical protein
VKGDDLLSLDEVIDDMLDTPEASQIFIRKSRDNPKYTHTIVAMNSQNVICRRILYDKRIKAVFKDDLRNQQTSTRTDWNRVEIQSLLEIHKEEMIRLVTNGLKWSIDNHGTITKQNIISAAKRVTTVLYNFLGVRVSFNKNGRQVEYTDAYQYINE